MPVWNIATVDREPEVDLICWTVYEVESTHYNGEKTRHFVGYHPRYCEGRVSSKVITFDAATMTGVTNSGRVYRLLGDSGYNSDADYVWQSWRAINGVISEKEVNPIE